MNEYDIDPASLRDLPDDTPITVYVEPAVLNLKRRVGGSRLVPISTTLGDVRKALTPTYAMLEHRDPGC